MRKLLVIVIATMMVVSIPTAFSAAPKVGGSCVKVNQFFESKSSVLVCATVKGKKTWRRATTLEKTRYLKEKNRLAKAAAGDAVIIVPTPSASPTPKTTVTPTAVPSPTPAATVTPTVVPSPNPTAAPTPTRTPTPTAAPTPTRTPTPTAAPTPTRTPTPTAAPTPTPTAAPTPNTLKLTPIPTISGILQAGNLLTVSTGIWDEGVTLGFQWVRSDGKIVGNLASYTISGEDVGKTVWVNVTGSKSGLAPVVSSSIASKTISEGTLILSPISTISGALEEGQILTAVPGIWDEGVEISFQWLRNGSEIPEARARTYQLTSSDIGSTISLKVSATKLGFLTKVNTSSSATPVVAKPIPKPSFSGSGSLVINSTSSIYIYSLSVRTGKVTPETGVTVTARLWCEKIPAGTLQVQYPTISLTLTTNNSYGNAGSFAGIVDISSSKSQPRGVFGTYAKIRGEVTASNASGSTTALIEGPYIESCIKG